MVTIRLPFPSHDAYLVSLRHKLVTVKNSKLLSSAKLRTAFEKMAGVFAADNQRREIFAYTC